MAPRRQHAEIVSRLKSKVREPAANPKKALGAEGSKSCDSASLGSTQAATAEETQAVQEPVEETQAVQEPVPLDSCKGDVPMQEAQAIEEVASAEGAASQARKVRKVDEFEAPADKVPAPSPAVGPATLDTWEAEMEDQLPMGDATQHYSPQQDAAEHVPPTQTDASQDGPEQFPATPPEKAGAVQDDPEDIPAAQPEKDNEEASLWSQDAQPRNSSTPLSAVFQKYRNDIGDDWEADDENSSTRAGSRATSAAGSRATSADSRRTSTGSLESESFSQPSSTLSMAKTTVPDQDRQTMMKHEHAALCQSDVKCTRCFRVIDLLKAQIKCKSVPKFLCNPCNRVSVMLPRNMAWPSPDFSAMPADEQQKFWEKAGNLAEEPGGLKYGSLRGLLKRTLCRSRETAYQTVHGGSFQPLSWYSGQGYNATAIAKNSADSDTKWHPVLEEMTYRLEICSSQKSIIDKEVESHLVGLEASMKKRKKPGDDAPNKCSSSSSSSSSSKRRKNKKDKKKKNKKDKSEKHEKTEKELAAEAKAKEKQQALEAKAKEREEAKEKAKLEKETRMHNAAQASLATKTVAAISGVLAMCVETSKKKGIDDMPAVVKDKFKAEMEKLRTFKAEADAVLKDVAKAAKKGDKLQTLSFDLKETTTLTASAKHSCGSLNQMLSVAASMSPV